MFWESFFPELLQGSEKVVSCFFFLFRSVNNAWSHILFVYGNIRYIISELVSSLSWGNIFRRKNVLYRCYTDVLSTWRMSLHVKWRFRNSLYFECNSRTLFNIFLAKNNNISFLLDEDLVSVKRPVWLVSKQVCLDPYIRCDISFLWEVLITRLLSTKYCKLPGTLTQLVFLSSLLCVINQFPSQKGNEWKKVGSRWVI